MRVSAQAGGRRGGRRGSRMWMWYEVPRGLTFLYLGVSAARGGEEKERKNVSLLRTRRLLAVCMCACVRISPPLGAEGSSLVRSVAQQ